MAAPKRTSFQIIHDRKEIAEHYLRGLTQREIAEKLSNDPGRGYTLSIQTISRDLEMIRREWRAATVKSLGDMKAQELAKLNEVERNAWNSWERSLSPKQRTKTGRRDTRPESRSGRPGAVTDSVEVLNEERNGDPRYLAVVQACIDRRCKLLGLDEPIVVRLDGVVNRVPWEALSNEQRRRLAAGESLEDVIPGFTTD